MNNAAGNIRIGRVTEGGKLHVVVRGQSKCPVAAHRPITAPAKASSVEPATACKHCTRPANLLRVEQANAGGSVEIDAMLDRLAGPEARKRSAELVARYHAAQVVAVKPRTLAEQRAANLRTHVQPSDRPAYVNIAA